MCIRDSHSPLTPTHIYADNGIYNVTLTVRDNDGGVTIDTLTVTVNNVGPTITDISGDTNVDEGTPAYFSATATDPGNDTLTYTWNFGDGTDAVVGQNVNHTFADNGIYTVTLTVSDEDGASTTKTLSTKVNNVAPTVAAGDNQIMYIGETVAFWGQFTDPGILDTHTVVWDFGDSNTVAGTLRPTHIYNSNGTYSVTLTVTDDDGGVTNNTLTVTVKKPPTLSVNDISLIEGDDGNAYAVFTASLSEASLRTVTANFATADGTAITGSDYLATTGTITFNPGKTTQTITVAINGDRIDEYDETFFLNLSDATNATIADAQAVATILDNDAPPTLTITDKTITESDNGTTTAIFTVSLDAASGKPVTVNFATANGTAIAGSDYTATSGTLSFAPGETTKTISVQLNGDITDEYDETFFLNLSDATNATITDAQAVGTILDNDAPPVLTINDKTITEGDNGTTYMSFTVSLSVASAKPITVDYTTANGTAIAGSDYKATSGTLSFAPGETSQTIIVEVIGDHNRGADETFAINLSNATNAAIADAQGTGTIVDDDRTDGFAIRAEGTVTINGSGDFDGNPLDLYDDTLIYAAKGFNINGNPVLPVKRDAQGNPIRDAQGKLILIENAVAVAPGYTVSNASNSNQYANLVPPQIVEPQTIIVPAYASVKQQELERRIPTGATTLTFNMQQNPMNNAADWAKKFPPSGTASNPTVVRVTGGGLNIPANVSLNNYVIIVEQGDINFNGSGHNLNNVVLVTNNGNVNLSTVQARDLSVLVSGSINMNGGARFAGNTILANGSSQGNITFNGATSTVDESSNLQVISQGDLTYNGSANTRGTFLAAKNFTYNGNSTLFGSIDVKGNIIFNGQATVTAIGES